jgi:hypothetical protein
VLQHRSAVAYNGYFDVNAVRRFYDGARLPLSLDIAAMLLKAA